MKPIRPARLASALLLLPATLLVLACSCLGGCSPSTGPSAAQNRAGQDVRDSVLNKVTLTDDQGTTSAEVAGPTDWIKQDMGGTLSHTTGQVTRTMTLARPDGTNFALRSGSDITASGVEFDPETGLLRVATFTTSSSAPIDALGRLQREYQETFRALSADKRAVAEAQAAAFVESLDKLSPTLAALAKGLLGIP